MLKSTQFLVFFLAVILLNNCGSTQSRTTASSSTPDPIEFSTKHLPLEKWKRAPDCCTTQGKKFAIATAGTHAALAAADINERGCNVVDAGIAATFVLAVERPQSTGIGGGGFLTLYLRKPSGAVSQFVDFRETAPRNATADMYLKDGKKIENLSRDGVHAAGTPGFVAGLYDAYKTYGSHNKKCGWGDLIKPAIELASKGFAVYPSLEDRIVIRKDILAADPTASKLYLPKGNPLKTGDILVQKDLAKTLRTIAKTGKQDFYQGAIAKKISQFIAKKALSGVGHVDFTDLKNYKVDLKDPLEGTYLGYRVLTAPPPSAGGVALIESLNILSGFDLAAEKSQARYLHILSETLLRTYADRTIIGDIKDDATYKGLLTSAYADKARTLINLEHPTPAKDIKPAALVTDESPHTAHTSIMDGDGNAVSITTTVNFYFGAGVVVPGTGIFLNDEMDDFATQPGGTNLSGLPDSAPNAIAPGKRPISSMIPTIVLQGEQPVLVVGAAGSSTIISGVLQTILNDLVVWPHDLKRAVFAARAHKQYDPKNDVLTLEPNGFSKQTEAALIKMGHSVQPAKFSPQVQAVEFNPQTGMITAVHEPRDEGGVSAK